MFGKIKVEVISGLYNDFLNELIQRGYYVSKVEPTQFGVMFCCYGKNYREIANIAKKHQCRTKVVKKSKAALKVKRILSRKGALCGAAAVLIYIFLFSKLIWRIDVISPDSNITNDIYRLLYKNDVYAGAVFSQEKNQDIIQQIFVDMDDVGYVTLNFYKGVLVCKVDPVIEKMPYLSDSTSGNITASQDGVILEMRVYKGFPNVKVGQTVNKGDILVSATYIDRNGTMQQVMPRAYIKAACVKKYTVQLPLEKEVLVPTGRTQQDVQIKFMGKSFTVKRADLSEYRFYDSKSSYEYISFMGFKLPLTKEIITYYEKQTVKTRKDRQQAQEIAQKYIDTIIENDKSLEKIVEKEYSVSFDENTFTMQCVIDGEYDITK